MRSEPTAAERETARFRGWLRAAMLVVVGALTLVALVVARRQLSAAHAREREQEFRAALTAHGEARRLRRAMLLERAAALARRPRLHAALEDDALDLLYPSAQDELRDLLAASRLEGEGGRGEGGGSVPSADGGGHAAHAAPAVHGGPTPASATAGQARDAGAGVGAASSEGGDAVEPLSARFYRFLDRDGRVIPPDGLTVAGDLPAPVEARLALPGLTAEPQLGYLEDAPGGVAEVLAMPLFSGQTGEVIAALVLGFALDAGPGGGGVVSDVWVDDRLVPLGTTAVCGAEEAPELAGALRAALAGGGREGHLGITLAGAPYLVFYQRLNPGSRYSPAYEVGLFPLADLEARQRRLAWTIFGVGLGVLLCGTAASHVLAGRFARWFGTVARAEAEQRIERVRAQARLEATSVELERAARFAADASHQLKTPVTVLRAGLEELLAGEQTSPAAEHEIEGLIRQTRRLSQVIEDLLLLSRLDAGLLRIRFGPVDLSRQLAAALDDLDALPDPLGLEVEADVSPGLYIAGEARYLALIVENLLENARKYNRPHGRLRIAARAGGDAVHFTVANTTRAPIPPEVQGRLFERFHRGNAGENVPGYGLGLNLARELARLHEGDLRLVRSDGEWTEFEVTLRRAEAPQRGRTGGEGAGAG